MPIVTFQPGNRSVDALAGQTILEVATALGLPVVADCGGLGTCGKCRVRFDDQTPPPNDTEIDLVPPASLAAGYRLACQRLVSHDVTVWVGDADRSRPSKGMVAINSAPLHLNPLVRRIPLRELPVSGLTWGPGVDRSMLERANIRHSSSSSSYEAILFGCEVINVRPASGRPVLGAAFDIGTTTIGGYLLDLETGEQKATLAIGNPQSVHGADVISRIHYTNTHLDGLGRMQGLCVSALNELLADMVDVVDCSANDVFYVTTVGNPTMIHLLLGVNPNSIATPPFEPLFHDPQLRIAKDLALDVFPAATVETLPIVSGYVGADSVGMALFLRLDQRDEVCIAIDVGTNGEIILSRRGALFACSTAAGPAFEGARITWGMRARPGAIDALNVDHNHGKFTVRTIAGGRPAGICGPGLLSVVATLFEAGVIDHTGRFVPQSPAASGRLRGTGATVEFMLANGAETEHGQDVVLTQRDVRELQLAKSAMAAGMHRLLSYAGLRLDDVEHIYLAGAFGSYLDPWSARRTGLLLPVPIERIVAVGNAAGAGGQMVLCSQDMRKVAVDLAHQIDYLELSGDAEFNDLFMREMEFPSTDGEG